MRSGVLVAVLILSQIGGQISLASAEDSVLSVASGARASLKRQFGGGCTKKYFNTSMQGVLPTGGECRVDFQNYFGDGDSRATGIVLSARNWLGCQSQLAESWIAESLHVLGLHHEELKIGEFSRKRKTGEVLTLNSSYKYASLSGTASFSCYVDYGIQLRKLPDLGNQRNRYSIRVTEHPEILVGSFETHDVECTVSGAVSLERCEDSAP